MCAAHTMYYWCAVHTQKRVRIGTGVAHTILCAVHTKFFTVYTLQIEPRKPVKPPTQSVVEVHQPKLAPPDPNGTADRRHVPRADADEIGVNDL